MSSRSPEQPTFEFPKEENEGMSDEILLEKIKERMRHEPAYIHLSPKDPAFEYMANIRLEQVKKKSPSVKHHDHFLD